MKSNKKYFRIIFSLLIILIVIKLFYFSKSLGYKLQGVKGRSKTIKESKERGVFVKELDYITKPDTIELMKEKCFFIEKGFRYGQFSAKETILLTELDDYKYTIIISPFSGRLFKKQYYKLGPNGDDSYFFKIKDTFKKEIIIQRPPDYDINKIGELFLFPKKDNGTK